MANGLEGVASFALAAPDRIVLDLEGASAGVSAAAGAGGVATVRIGQFSADVTRLVIDLDRPMTLSEVTADGDRTTLSVMIRPADAAGFARLVKSPRRSHVLGAAPPPARTAQPAPAAKPSPAPGKPVVTALIVEAPSPVDRKSTRLNSSH